MEFSCKKKMFQSKVSISTGGTSVKEIDAELFLNNIQQSGSSSGPVFTETLLLHPLMVPKYPLSSIFCFSLPV